MTAFGNSTDSPYMAVTLFLLRLLKKVKRWLYLHAHKLTEMCIGAHCNGGCKTEAHGLNMASKCVLFGLVKKIFESVANI